MKSRTILAGPVLLLLLSAASQVAAQHVTPTAPDTYNAPEYMSTREASYSERQKLTGEITRVNADDNTVIVREAKTGTNYTFHVNKDTQFKADRKTDLAGRKQLSLADFKKGHPVRLTVRSADGKLLEVRLRHKES